MQGKGSARRPTNEAAYGRNYSSIRWKSADVRARGMVEKYRRDARIVRHVGQVVK